MSAAELALAALLGAAVGGLAGLVPGAHPNAVALLALGALPALGPGASEPAAAALVAMGMAHVFTALVPAGFLGAPGAEDALRALPAQELLREGRAAEAVHLAALGAALGTLTGLALLPLLRLLLGPGGTGYRWLEPALPAVLMAIAAVLLLTEDARVPWRRALRAEAFPAPGQAEARGLLEQRRGALLRLRGPAGAAWVHDPLGLLGESAPGSMVAARGRWARVEGPGSAALGVLAACLVFGVAALLGLAAQRIATPSPLGLPGSPMFPLLTGLFGVPPLLLALRAGPVPAQPDRPAPLGLRGAALPAASGAACGALVGLLPGMSASAASVLALAAAPRRDREGVLVALSAAAAGAAVVTAAAFVLVQRARSGAMLAVAELVPPEPWLGLAPPGLLAAIVLGVVAGAAMGYAVCVAAGRAACRVVERVPYARLSAAVLALLACLVAAFTGPPGLVVLAAASLVGLLPWALGLRKGHLMGCTMGPLILPGA